MPESDPSSQVPVVSLLPATEIGTPSTTTGDSVVVPWTNNDDSSDGGIDVERSNDGGSSWTTVASGLSPSTSSYEDTSTTPGEVYQYRVRRYTDHASERSGTAAIQYTPGAQAAAGTPTGGAVTATRAGAGHLSASATAGGAGFGGSASFPGGDQQPTTAIVGGQSTIAAVQGATTSAATAVGPAASVVEPKVHVRAHSSVGAANASLTQVGGHHQQTTTVSSADATAGATGGSPMAAATLGAGAFSLSVQGGRQTAASSVFGGSIPDWILHLPGSSAPVFARPDDVSLTPQTLSMSVTVARNQIGQWRQFNRAGDFSVKRGYGGSFETVDQGGRQGPISLEAPRDEQPPFTTSDWYVNGYDEQQAAADRYEVSLTLQRLRNRADEYTPPSETSAWTLDLATGSLGLDTTQVGHVSESGTTAAGEWTLPLRVTPREAAAVVDVAGYPDAVVTREVPDGEDVVEDTTPGGRQTVTVSTPPGASFPAGEYAIDGWELSHRGYGRYRWQVELTLLEL